MLCFCLFLGMTSIEKPESRFQDLFDSKPLKSPNLDTDSLMMVILYLLDSSDLSIKMALLPSLICNVAALGNKQLFCPKLNRSQPMRIVLKKSKLFR